MAAKTQRYHEAKTKQPIKFVYFDIGNVLLTYSESVASLANVLNAPFQEVYDFWVVRDDALNRGTLTAGEFWQGLKTHFRYKGQDIDVLDLWVTNFQPIKESHIFARTISQTRKIGLLTNAMPGAVAKTKAHGYIPEAPFAAIIDSSVLGITKPDPKIFTIAQKQAGVAAGEILFIDDKAHYLDVAHTMGFHTYHFDPDNPAASVRELEQLVDLSPHVPCVTK